MIIGVLNEALPGETRVAATPDTVEKLIALGYSVVIESGAGAASSFSDDSYVAAGASIGDAATADIIFGINAPSTAQLDRLREGTTVISLLAQRSTLIWSRIWRVDASPHLPWMPYRVSRAPSH